MSASFRWRGIDYGVSGWLWSSDGDRNGMIICRDDGRSIRGARMHPGMVQTGISRMLAGAARRALQASRRAEQAEDDSATDETRA